MRIELNIKGVYEEQLRGAVVWVLDDCGRQQAEDALKGHRGVVELADSLASATLEIWASRSHAQPDVLQFVASARIDLAEWGRMGRPARWYPLHGGEQQRSVGLKAGVTALVAEEEPLRTQLRIRCLDGKHCKPSEAAAAMNTPPAASNPSKSPPESSRRRQSKHEAIRPPEAFHFQIPTVPVTRSRRFRDARVGQIVRERRTDVIEALLPIIPTAVTASTPENQPAMGKAAMERMAAMRKALVLLQFSCQYTLHCVHALDDRSRNLVSCREKTAERVERLKQRSRRLKGRAATLRRESQSTSSSLNAVRLLLQELDPETMTKLEGDFER